LLSGDLWRACLDHEKMKENGGSGGGLLDEVTRSGSGGILLVGGQAHAALAVATAGCQSGRGQ